MTIQTYDDSNVFAKILRGEIPCFKLYEDDRTFVFMDIMPRGDGHCLVIPKRPARNLLDVDADDLTAVAVTTQRMARAAMRALGAQGVTIQQFNEPAGGQEVYHLHFHVIPRFDGVKMRPPGQMEDKAKLAEYAERIRAALA